MAAASASTSTDVMTSQQVCGGWRLGNVLGKGTYGEVRVAFPSDALARELGASAHDDFVLKLSTRSSELRREHIIYRRLESLVGFPAVDSVHAYGHCYLESSDAEPPVKRSRLDARRHTTSSQDASFATEYTFLVMEALGPDLRKVLQAVGPPYRLPGSVVRTIGVQMLARLQTLHAAGFIHCDLKPANMALGLAKRGEEDHIYLFDLGLAERYDVERHDWEQGMGTDWFTSIDADDEDAPPLGRHFDLQSLAYVLVYLARGTLPWINGPGTRKEEKRRRTTDELLNTPHVPPELRTFTREVLRMDADTDVTDYTYLQTMLGPAEPDSLRVLSRAYHEGRSITDMRAPRPPRSSPHVLGLEPARPEAQADDVSPTVAAAPHSMRAHDVLIVFPPAQQRAMACVAAA